MEGGGSPPPPPPPPPGSPPLWAFHSRRENWAAVDEFGFGEDRDSGDGDDSGLVKQASSPKSFGSPSVSTKLRALRKKNIASKDHSNDEAMVNSESSKKSEARYRKLKAELDEKMDSGASKGFAVATLKKHGKQQFSNKQEDIRIYSVGSDADGKRSSGGESVADKLRTLRQQHVKKEQIESRESLTFDDAMALIAEQEGISVNKRSRTSSTAKVKRSTMLAPQSKGKTPKPPAGPPPELSCHSDFELPNNPRVVRDSVNEMASAAAGKVRAVSSYFAGSLSAGSKIVSNAVIDNQLSRGLRATRISSLPARQLESEAGPPEIPSAPPSPELSEVSDDDEDEEDQDGRVQDRDRESVRHWKKKLFRPPTPSVSSQQANNCSIGGSASSVGNAFPHPPAMPPTINTGDRLRPPPPPSLAPPPPPPSLAPPPPPSTPPPDDVQFVFAPKPPSMPPPPASGLSIAGAMVPAAALQQVLVPPSAPVLPPPQSSLPPEHAFRQSFQHRRPLSVDNISLPRDLLPLRRSTVGGKEETSLSSGSSSSEEDEEPADGDTSDADASVQLWNAGLTPINFDLSRPKSHSIPNKLGTSDGDICVDRRRYSELPGASRFTGEAFNPTQNARPKTEMGSTVDEEEEDQALQGHSEQTSEIKICAPAISLAGKMRDGHCITSPNDGVATQAEFADYPNSCSNDDVVELPPFKVLDDLEELRFMRPPDHPPPGVKMPSLKKPFFAYEYPDSVVEAADKSQRRERSEPSQQEFPFSPKLKAKNNMTKTAGAIGSNNHAPTASCGVVSTLDYCSATASPNTKQTWPTALVSEPSFQSNKVMDDAFSKQVSTQQPATSSTTDIQAAIVQILRDKWLKSPSADSRILIPRHVHETIYLLDPSREGLITEGQVAQLVNEGLGLQLEPTKVLSLCQLLDQGQRGKQLLQHTLTPSKGSRNNNNHSPLNGSWRSENHVVQQVHNRFPYRLLVKAFDDFLHWLQQRPSHTSPSAGRTSFSVAQVSGSPSGASFSSLKARAVAVNARLAQYAKWIDALKIWRNTVGVNELVEGGENGMLLCALVNRLLEQRAQARNGGIDKDSNSYTNEGTANAAVATVQARAGSTASAVSIARNNALFGANRNVKLRARKHCIENIELALSVVWRQPGARIRNLPTALQVFEGEPEAVLKVLREIVTTLVFGGAVATSSRLNTVLAWVDRALRQTGRRLPNAVLRSPHHKLWEHFCKADLLLCVLFHYFPKAVKLECVHFNPVSPAEIRSNCDELMNYLRQLNIPTGLTAEDMCNGGEEQLDILVLLLFAMYYRLRFEKKLDVAAVSEPTYHQSLQHNKRGGDISLGKIQNCAIVKEARKFMEGLGVESDKGADSEQEAASIVSNQDSVAVVSVNMSVEDEPAQQAIAEAVVRAERRFMARESYRALARAQAKQTQRVQSRWDAQAASAALQQQQKGNSNHDPLSP